MTLLTLYTKKKYISTFNIKQHAYRLFNKFLCNFKVQQFINNTYKSEISKLFF